MLPISKNADLMRFSGSLFLFKKGKWRLFSRIWAAGGRQLGSSMAKVLFFAHFTGSRKSSQNADIWYKLAAKRRLRGSLKRLK